MRKADDDGECVYRTHNCSAYVITQQSSIQCWGNRVKESLISGTTQLTGERERDKACLGGKRKLSIGTFREHTRAPLSFLPLFWFKLLNCMLCQKKKPPCFTLSPFMIHRIDERPLVFITRVVEASLFTVVTLGVVKKTNSRRSTTTLNTLECTLNDVSSFDETTSSNEKRETTLNRRNVLSTSRLMLPARACELDWRGVTNSTNRKKQ